MAINWNGKGCDAAKKMWIVSDGREVPISEMAPEHIRSCVDYIKTFGGQLTASEHSKLEELERELLER